MKIDYKIRRMKWRLNATTANIGRRLIRWAARDCNLVRHAKTEWAIAFPNDCEMQAAIGEHIIDMVAMFSAEGHSGSSAGYSIAYLKKALSFEPLSPLTGAESEWAEPYDSDGTRQNKRCGRVFMDADGKAYDIDGKVFVEPDGAAYTSRDSRVYVTFPYVPTTERVPIDRAALKGEPQ